MLTRNKGMDVTFITKSYKIKNLISGSTILLLKEILTQSGFLVHQIQSGRVTLSFNPAIHSENKFIELLKKYDLDIISQKDRQMVEDIKIAVHELIHDMNNMNSIVRRSDYLVEKLGKNYQILSRVFSKHENTTLEKYLILQKIQRVQELIDEDEFTLSEIAYMMEYSSVQYLSNQFKKIIGFSVSDYKKRKLC